jgi:hypothetical protein
MHLYALVDCTGAVGKLAADVPAGMLVRSLGTKRSMAIGLLGVLLSAVIAMLSHHHYLLLVLAQFVFGMFEVRWPFVLLPELSIHLFYFRTGVLHVIAANIHARTYLQPAQRACCFDYWWGEPAVAYDWSSCWRHGVGLVLLPGGAVLRASVPACPCIDFTPPHHGRRQT